METEVIMKRELFGCQISQKSKSQFFSATELVHAGDKFRREQGLSDFNLSLYLKGASFLQFKEEVEKKYGQAIISGRGRSAQTWVHPLIFIDIALAINPKLKLEVYEWIFDHLIKFRNDSGDSYKEMSAALFTRFGNVREFQKYIASVADEIRDALNVSDWQTATEQQLEKRDKLHRSIKLLCRVLTDTKQIIRLSIAENV